MEDKKDKYKGHNNQSVGSAVHSVVFGDNRFHAFAFKKTEKLISALYLVTSFVPENELIREILREKSLCLLSDIMSLRVLSHKLQPTAISTVVATILEIVALLEIGYNSGFISEMNMSVLKEEYLTLGALLKRKGIGSASRDVHITEDMLAVSDMYLVPSPHSQESFGGNSGDKISIRQRNNEKISKKRIETGTQAQKTISTESIQSRHNERKQHILKLIKTKGTVSVRDVTTVVSDCSEKTLQRELLALVKIGILKKKGEKRWSTYSLV